MLFKRKSKSSLTLETKQLIYESHFEHVYRLALYITHDKAAAKEVTQEAFTKAFEKYHQLKDPSKIAAWIKTITLNTARSHFSKEKKVISLDIEKINYIQNQFSNDQANDFTYQMGLEEELSEAIQTLPEDFQDAIILKYYHDLEISEIAKITEVSEGTVKSRLYRARNRLKKELKDIELTAREGV